MGTKGDTKARSKKGAGRNRPVKPPLGRRLWHLIINHPKGVLIGAATLLGLIVVFQNWRSTPAFLLVTDVSLPFVVWALVFMVVGYATGKWLEWGWRQRKIRRGTYKPRVSPEDLANAAASLEERREDVAGERTVPADGEEPDEDEPATMIDRSRSGKAGDSIPPVERVDYWEEPPPGADGGPEPRVDHAGVPTEASGSAEGHRRPAGDWSPAARHAARAADRARRGRRGDGPRDYQDGGRYGDYQDGGRYGDYQDSGRYGDYQDAGRYSDYQDSGRYEDYGDYGDSGGESGPRRGGGGRRR